MAVSMKNVDSAFQSVGQKAGIEIWRIENFCPTPLPKADYGKFYCGDSYIVLKTTASKTGALRYDIHFWLGKDTSQDEAGTAAIKAVELDAALGGRAVQYREVQGYETEKFLTYFRPCIIPLEGGIATGFKKVVVEKYEPRLFVCKGRHVVRVKQVPFARSSLNHDDVFILDTEPKIYQFNGVNCSIQERSKALEAVQYIKDADHDGKCDIAIIEDGKLVAEIDTGEFWSLFGGFAPIGRKASSDDSQVESQGKLLCVVEGHAKDIGVSPLKREILETDKCYLLDCGLEIFIWFGRNTGLEERKAACLVVEEYVSKEGKPSHTRITRLIEGFETFTFKSNFDAWISPPGADTVSEEGRGKVAALLKQQGINVKGLLKGAPAKEEEIPPLLDASGKLEVWRVNGKSKTGLPAEDYGKFLSGDCYIVLYTYPGERKEMEQLLCCWIGKQSTVEEQLSALRQLGEMSTSRKGRPVQAKITEGKEPAQFLALFQNVAILKGGSSIGYKEKIGETGSEDETYTEETVALIRVRGTGRHNSKAVQMESVATSLNSSDCFVMQIPKAFLLWFGSFSTAEEQQLAARYAEFLRPGVPVKSIKEGSEPASLWNALGGKKAYPSQREPREPEKDPRLFVCLKNKGSFAIEEIPNYTQDDLLSDDLVLLDAYNEIFVWLGQQTSIKEKEAAFSTAEKYLERASLLDGLSKDVPIYKMLEGYEPVFFTKYFTWDPAKSAILVDPYERRLAVLQGRTLQATETPPKKRGSSGDTEITPASSQRKSALAALSSTFVSPVEAPKPLSGRKSPPFIRTQTDSSSTPSSATGSPKQASPKPELETVVSELSEMTLSDTNGDGEKQSRVYPYERLKVKSSEPVSGIDITRRENYLSPEEFETVFGMDQTQFSELPKWKQDKLKKAVDLF